MLEQDARRRREEFANAITHGLGAVLSLAAGTVLIVMAALGGSASDVVGAAVFAASLVLLYGASTVYHAVAGEIARRRLKVLDHAAIYVLIAGTYTPFMLGMRGAWGWSLFGVIWGLAAAGVVFKLFFTGRYPRVSTALYIAMGWLIVIAAGPLLRHLDTATVIWLAAGGIAYTAGTAFFHAERIPYAHAVWHGFVIAGSACHAVAVGLHIGTA